MALLFSGLEIRQLGHMISTTRPRLTLQIMLCLSSAFVISNRNFCVRPPRTPSNLRCEPAAFGFFMISWVQIAASSLMPANAGTAVAKRSPMLPRKIEKGREFVRPLICFVSCVTITPLNCPVAQPAATGRPHFNRGAQTPKPEDCVGFLWGLPSAALALSDLKGFARR